MIRLRSLDPLFVVDFQLVLQLGKYSVLLEVLQWGAAMESSGTNDMIADGLNTAIQVGQDFYPGAINTYHFLKCGYGECH